MSTVYAAASNIDDILITPELHSRKARACDSIPEAEAYVRLAETMNGDPNAALPALVQAGVNLCKAGSCGLSVLQGSPGERTIFRWSHMAGVYKDYVGGTTPRDFSPCGATLDRRSPQLFRYPGRLFTYFQAVEPPIVEGLVLPLFFEHAPLGTLWIVAHDEERKFDSEDVRVMTALAYFTVAALRACDESTLPFSHAAA